MIASIKARWTAWRRWLIIHHPQLALVRLEVIVPVIIVMAAFMYGLAVLSPVSRSNVPDVQLIAAWSYVFCCGIAIAWSVLVVRASAKMPPLLQHAGPIGIVVLVCSAGLLGTVPLYHHFATQRVADLLTEKERHDVERLCEQHRHFELTLACPRQFLIELQRAFRQDQDALENHTYAFATERALHRVLTAAPIVVGQPRGNVDRWLGGDFAPLSLLADSTPDVFFLLVPIIVAAILLSREEGIWTPAHFLLPGASALGLGIMLDVLKIEKMGTGPLWLTLSLGVPFTYALCWRRKQRHFISIRWALSWALALSALGRVALEKNAVLHGKEAVAGFVVSSIAVLLLHFWLTRTRQLPLA